MKVARNIEKIGSFCVGSVRLSFFLVTCKYIPLSPRMPRRMSWYITSGVRGEKERLPRRPTTIPLHPSQISG